MKSVSTKVSIGSDQVKVESRRQLNYDGKSLSLYDPKDSIFTKDGRKTVELGEINVDVPTTADDVVALLTTDAAMVVKTLATQMVTNAANAYRKSFTKDGEAGVKQANREAVRRWMFTPVGMPFSAEYMSIPTNETKRINDWLDQKFEEHLANGE